MSDEEEDDGCDLFADSEKEEEDAEDVGEHSRPVRRAVTPIAWRGFRDDSQDTLLLLACMFVTVSLCIVAFSTSSL